MPDIIRKLDDVTAQRILNVIARSRTAGCPRSRGFRDLGFHRRVSLEISPEVEEALVAPRLET
jgi:hypothetical protein